MAFETLNFGNILGQAENIIGQRTQNALGQQQLDVNALARQRENQFNMLLQNYLQTGDEESAKRLIQVNPEDAQRVFNAQMGEFQVEKEKAAQAVRFARAVQRSKDPVALVKARHTNFVQQLNDSGRPIDEVPREELVRMAEKYEEIMLPFAGDELTTSQAGGIKTFEDREGNQFTLDLTNPEHRKLAVTKNLREVPTREETAGPGGFAAPTTASQTRAQETIDSADLTLATINDMREVLSPQNTGAVGDIRRFFQGVGQQSEAARQWLGGQADEIIGEILDNDDPLNTNLFTLDPSLSAMELLENVLTYRLARTNDDNGKVSDEDFTAAKGSLGFDKIFTGAGDISAKLDSFEKIVLKQKSIAERRLGMEQGKDKKPGKTGLPSGIPAGSRVVGTVGGFPVYEAPDGSRYQVKE